MVLQVLVKMLEMEQQAWPTTLQQDKQSAQRPHLLSERSRMAVTFRIEKKVVLGQALDATRSRLKHLKKAST